MVVEEHGMKKAFLSMDELVIHGRWSTGIVSANAVMFTAE